MQKKYLWGPRQGGNDLYTADGAGAEISYPPFLWITMCMNV